MFKIINKVFDLKRTGRRVGLVGHAERILFMPMRRKGGCMVRDNAPRLNVEISEEQDKALRELIPWGMKHHLFSAIIDEVIEVLKEHGEIAITAIACKKVRFIDILSKKEK